MQTKWTNRYAISLSAFILTDLNTELDVFDEQRDEPKRIGRKEDDYIAEVDDDVLARALSSAGKNFGNDTPLSQLMELEKSYNKDNAEGHKPSRQEPFRWWRRSEIQKIITVTLKDGNLAKVQQLND